MKKYKIYWSETLYYEDEIEAENEEEARSEWDNIPTSELTVTHTTGGDDFEIEEVDTLPIIEA